MKTQTKGTKKMKQNMMSIEEINAKLSNKRDKNYLRVSKIEHQGTTVEIMCQQTVHRIDQTVSAIKEFAKTDWKQSMKSNPLNSAMARRVLGGIEIKIGFGTKNEKIGIEPAQFKLNRDAQDYDEAIEWLEKVRAFILDGAFDAVFEAKLQGYQERAALGKQARSSKNNVSQFANAA
jgi:hypothetical protein